MTILPKDLASDAARDRHWFGPGPKRILSIDGGGVRGVIALAFLERYEALLNEQAGRPVRLCDHFDLIGGTSTGSIVATALSLGFSAAQVRDFYLQLAPKIFRKPYFRLAGWHAKFDAEALRRELSAVIGERALGSEDLQTGLGIVLKRLDAGSSWILTNNPRAKFWATPPDRAFIGNKTYPLVNVVRASTAAPHYFDPQEIQLVEGEKPALFVDGGLTPHNDPSLALLLAAIQPCYGVNWPTGADKLSVVSIGTGSFRPRVDAQKLRRGSSVTVALHALVQQIAENQKQTLALMSWLGQGGAPWPINSEIGDLSETEPDFGALFQYRRFDVQLEQDWLKDKLGVELTPQELAQARRFDDPDAMARLYEIGKRAAEGQVGAGVIG